MPKAHYELKGVDPSKIKGLTDLSTLSKKKFRFCVWIRSLHNSKDLFKSFKSIYDSLNENSFLIFSDM